ncbi:hypothetical protein LTS18_011244, partial [Coniosporium uncinatum]
MDEVLTTTERLESILLHVPSRKLFTLRRISHYCNVVLVKSITLQRLMLLAPIAPVLETKVVACDVPMRNSSRVIFPSADMQIGKGRKLVTYSGGADVKWIGDDESSSSNPQGILWNGPARRCETGYSPTK